MMLEPAVALAAGYAVFLLLVAFGLDLMARRTAGRTTSWRSGAFTYHEDHDAWICPEDQWLWPQSLDPENRVMRYRASPAVCNSCPVKETCTSSDGGREITRNIDPWPSSEAERFHRGIACSVAALALVWPLAMMVGDRTGTERVVLAAAICVVALGSWPLWSHLRRSPAGFPEHIKVERPDDVAAARAVAAAREARRRSGYRSERLAAGPVPVDIERRRPDLRGPTQAERDRFATRWGAFEGTEAPPDAGWSRMEQP